MEYIKLGHSDLKVSRICFGCAPMGGYDYGDVDDGESIHSVLCALDNGVNFFDTAAIYGFGHAESVLGRALSGRRGSAIIATKGGLRKAANKIIPDLSPEFLRSDLESSLRRLGTDCIDLYQLHYLDPDVPAEKYAVLLNDFLCQGKIRFVGLSNFSKESSLIVNEVLPVACVQLPYNLLQRSLESRGIPDFCVDKHVGLITYSSLARGYLTGKKYTREDFKGSDTRARSSYFSADSETVRLPVTAALNEAAAMHSKTQAQTALRWLLDKPFVSSVIVGIKGDAQILEAVNSCHWNLDPKASRTLDAVSQPFMENPLY